jgi:guanosine-3',5'-bis(diphosphate) 3'-pyrophosphohydrolase
MDQAKGLMLSKMRSLVVEAFAGVYDKGGRPYVLHCLQVMMWLDEDDEELQCIGLGHDLLEDTSVTEARLIELGFSRRVIDGIKALTKLQGESYEDYKAKVKANRDAVKMKDLRHNSDISRLKGLRPKDIERVARYRAFYVELSAIEKLAD